MSEPATFLYIMGRGHSGSTILDILLDNADDVVGIGEFSATLAQQETRCACGDDACPFWAAVEDEFERSAGRPWADDARKVGALGYAKNLPTVARIGRDDPRIVEQLDAFHDMNEAIPKVSGRTHIVDSSKELPRGLFVGRFAPGAQLLYLVRNPVDVVASDLFRFRKNEGQFRFQRRTISARGIEPLFVLFVVVRWWIGTLLAEAVRLRLGRPVELVRFEDLVADPAGALARVAQVTGWDLDSSIGKVERGEPLRKGHYRGGNPGVRGSDTVVLSAGRSRPLPGFYGLLVRLLCWPFMWAYGYRLRGGTAAGAAS